MESNHGRFGTLVEVNYDFDYIYIYTYIQFRKRNGKERS